jgi:3-hydroxyacyl-[acyl-carrier-protein] dehydratase
MLASLVARRFTGHFIGCGKRVRPIYYTLSKSSNRLVKPGMRFTFVDRILDLEPGAKITTVKCLSMAEEYLLDHFPKFPVMPGVLMLEAMTEAGAWLIRATDDFAHSIVTLKEARNVRFADFVQPGHTLTVTAELQDSDGPDVRLKTHATLDGHTAVGGRLVLHRSNLADTRPTMAATDAYLRQSLRAHFALIYPSAREVAADAAISPNGMQCEPTGDKL